MRCLANHAALRGAPQVWLQRLVDGMKDTVCAVIKQAQRDVYNQELEPFIFSHPAQISLLGIQFMWTADTQVRQRIRDSLRSTVTGAWRPMKQQILTRECVFGLVQAALANAKTDKSIMSKNMKKMDGILKEMVTITVKTSLSKNHRTNLETCITVRPA